MTITAEKIKRLCLMYGLEVSSKTKGLDPYQDLVNALAKPDPPSNANFLYFKGGGKYYSDGRGYVSKEVFDGLGGTFRPAFSNSIPMTRKARDLVLGLNGGMMPGLSGPCPYFHVIITMDKEVDFGWPIMLPAIPDAE